MKLRWRPAALRDRRHIIERVATDNRSAAADLDDRIEERLDALLAFPEGGRPGRIAGTREMVIAGTPYIVVHGLEASVIRVIRILHGARLWPPRAGRIR